MKSKSTFLSIILFLIAFNLNAQGDSNELNDTTSQQFGFSQAQVVTAPPKWYFVVNNDTTFCNELYYFTTIQGFLREIHYKDTNGVQISIVGRKNVPDVTTFYKDYKTYDKIPFKAHKPTKYIRYTQRVVDGELKVYYSSVTGAGGMQYTPHSPTGNWTSHGPREYIRLYIKMPDGKYYKATRRSTIKKIIKPYLLKCDEFRFQYDGKFSTKEDDVKYMVGLYNALCK